MYRGKILIIGKMPPPIGGVTIHVSRLLAGLAKLNYTLYTFYNINSNNFLKIGIPNIIKYKIIHLHSSSPYLRFLISFIGYISNKNIIITYHGDLLRFKKIGNFFDLLSIVLSKVPIVLNDRSYYIAKKWNNNTIKLSAFIPPDQEKELPKKIKNKIVSLTNKYLVFCTNAFNVSFDKNGNETYGITSLLSKFKELKNSALIVSDPSGNYKKYILQRKIHYGSNVLFISEPHVFFEVLKLSNAFIRNTTTDGDSLSIREALYLKKVVFASDVVSRPHGCILYNDIKTVNLEKELKQQQNIKSSGKKEEIEENVVEKLINIYNSNQ